MLPDQLLADAVWPQLRDLWNRKEAWAGCSELDGDLQNGWDQAQQCLTVLRQLGRNGILTIQHLKNTPDSWIGLSNLRRRHCEISEKEYNTFLEWIRAAGVLPAKALGTQGLTPATISAVQLKQTDNTAVTAVQIRSEQSREFGYQHALSAPCNQLICTIRSSSLLLPCPRVVPLSCRMSLILP